MMLFWLGVTLASLLAVAVVLVPLRLGGGATAAPRSGDNLAAFRAREAELAADLEAGLIDAAAHAAMHADLGRQLLADTRAPDVTPGAGRDWRLLAAASLAVPVLALAIYLPRGALEDVQLAADVRSAATGGNTSAAEGDDTAHDDAETRALMDRLRTRLVEQPDDADGWFLLGRTALASGAFPVAVEAFEALRSLVPEEPAVNIYLLQARYLADNRQESERVREAAQAVLAVNPNEPITREILAMTAFQRGEFRSVVDHLERALAGNVDPERRAFLQQGLAAARQRLGLPDEPLATTDTPAAGAAGPGISVNVQLAPELAGRFAADTTVFVMARPPGGRMPLAVVRRQLGDLPLNLRLDDSLAMNPAMPLSGVAEAEVVARISLAGTAMRGADDVEVVLTGVATDGSQAATLVIGGSGQVAASGTTPPRVTAPGPAPRDSSRPTAEAVAVRVLVELAPELSAEVGPDSTVFVFAREVDGPPAPLAARRLRVSDLPALITLTEADAMLPARTLASADRVRIGARISQGGGPIAQPGDLEGLSPAFAAADAQRVIAVVIDRRVGS